MLNTNEKVEITEGMICVAQYQQDHRWYRAKVEQVKANQVGEACLYLRERQWYRALVEQIKPGQARVVSMGFWFCRGVADEVAVQVV